MISLKHLKAIIWGMIINLPFPRSQRWRFARRMGIHLIPPPTNNPNDKKNERYLIGKNVTFDTVYPELIEIHNNVHITSGCVLLTHYLDTDSSGIRWKKGKIVLEENVFLGTHSIITKPVRIGRNSIVAAGSVVTKDIPPNEIWGGVPAKFIKKRIIK